MIDPKQNNYLFAAGGTGGHIFPALSIAEELKKIDKNANFMFLGTKNKMEAHLIPQHGYKFKAIWISGISRKFNIKNLMVPIKLIVSLIQSVLTIMKFKPSVVIGTGGYVCAPVLIVASLLNIKTVIHESNSYPGLVTRLLSAKVDKVFTAFEITKQWLKDVSKVEKVGNPTRKGLIGVLKKEGLEYFGLHEFKKVLLIIGGSLGSTSINTAILKSLELFLKSNIQVIWQTGERDYGRIQKEVDKLEHELRSGLWYGKFIDKMQYAYAAADLIICRAGAITIAEITLLGKPAILVPYPHATSDHQRLNAKTLEDAQAAIMIEDHELYQKIETVVLDLIRNEKRLKLMAENIKVFGTHNAGEIIAKKILELIS